MTQPRGYVDPHYLDAMAELIKQHKQRTYTWMHLQPGHTVLDVGCGPGTDTLASAGLVGPTGRVVGVDADAVMVAEPCCDTGVARGAATVPWPYPWRQACLMRVAVSGSSSMSTTPPLSWRK